VGNIEVTFNLILVSHYSATEITRCWTDVKRVCHMHQSISLQIYRKIASQDSQHDDRVLQSGAQPGGGIWGICPPP